jgi:predicted HNH restriction endonuclease
LSWVRVEAEIIKCDLVCANCHRMRTARRAGRLDDIDLLDVPAQQS